MQLPKALETLISKLELLPGVGRRTAERYAYDLFKSPPSVASGLAGALADVHSGLKFCPKTFFLIESDEEVSELYAGAGRDKQIVAVVAQPFDVIALESTGKFKGTYHVLKGLLSPIDGVGPEDLTISELIDRVKADKVKELIIATSGSVEGESTALYLQKQLAPAKGLSITRLARGLPVGVEIEFADTITLSQALEGRSPLINEG